MLLITMQATCSLEARAGGSPAQGCEACMELTNMQKLELDAGGGVVHVVDHRADSRVG